MIGSVINNILFVLGASIFFAALRNGRMTFSAQSAAGYASMLAIAVVGLALPTLATGLAEHASVDAEINVSIPFGIILIFSYISYLAATVFDVGARVKPKTQAVADEKSGKVEKPPAAEGLPMLGDDPRPETLFEKATHATETTRDTTSQ